MQSVLLIHCKEQKNHPFHPSTQQHENDVFEKIHPRERFRKDLFLVTENPTLSSCGRKPKTDKNRCVFQNIRIRVDGALDSLEALPH